MIDKKIHDLKKELKAMVRTRGSSLVELPGVGPVVAARALADTGDVTRFADRNRFASWTGTAPIEASSGEIVRHRLSRAGNRRINHMTHIADARAAGGPGRAPRGVSDIQRGRLTPAHRHFGSATSRTRTQHATPDHTDEEEPRRQTLPNRLLTQRGAGMGQVEGRRC
ncbi:MAG: transposase [Dermatophilaceae bacterium]